MSSATMVLQPPSPSADFVNDMEQDCDYMLDEFDSAMVESTEPVAELIFDWDDTLLPSTWLASQGFRLDFPAELPEDIILALSEHDQHVYKVLQKAMTFGNVVIITNAERGWVEMSAARFMPTTQLLLSEITVISARSNYEPEFPDDPLNWKISAFRAQIEDFNGQTSPSTEKNIISFGDSVHERDAIQHVGNDMLNTFVKSVKFVERPTLDQLQREVALLNNCMDYVCNCRSNLDLMLTIELLYE